MKQQLTGLPVEFPNFGAGPLISSQTYEINAESSLFNWNPPQIALVPYYDPNYNSVVTRSFAIGGSYGPTNINISTGSFRSEQYAAATQIVVFQQDVFASLPLGGPKIRPLQCNGWEGGLSPKANRLTEKAELSAPKHLWIATQIILLSLVTSTT